MRRDALDHIAQIHERIDLQVLTRLHQRTQDGGSVRRRFAPREQPVFAVMTIIVISGIGLNRYAVVTKTRPFCRTRLAFCLLFPT